MPPEAAPWFGAAGAALRRDWDTGIVQVSMMGLQGQTVVGSMVGLLQSVYLVQFGARADILSGYMLLGLPLNFAASCLAVAVLVGASMRHARLLFAIGCWSSLVVSLALTFPPRLYHDPGEQSAFVSHYFGALFVLATAGAKLRDYPLSLARVYLLQGTRARASENAYNKICDVMVGNALNGALLLSLLAHPSEPVKACLGALMVVSTLVSLRGASVLQGLAGPSRPEVPKGLGADFEAEVIGLKSPDAGVGSDSPCAAAMSLDGLSGAGGARAVWRLVRSGRLWQLMAIEWCAGFIFTLNNQAAGTIYWSSVVGVSDGMRSIFIALECALGGGVVGFATTLYVTRLYHSSADARAIIPRVVAVGAMFGSMLLATLGTTSLGALVGITSLYLYYFVFAWSNIEFLGFMDILRAEHGSDSPLLCAFLVKDIASGALNSLRNLVLLWLLAATGFYEPDCGARCASSADADCASRCHAEAHASIGEGTVRLVRALYVVVTPGAYLAGCALMRRYPAKLGHEARGDGEAAQRCVVDAL